MHILIDCFHFAVKALGQVLGLRLPLSRVEARVASGGELRWAESELRHELRRAEAS